MDTWKNCTNYIEYVCSEYDLLRLNIAFYTKWNIWFRPQRKRSKTEVVKDILNALDPEQYARIQRLTNAIKDNQNGGPKCFGTRCSDNDRLGTPNSSEGPVKVQDVLAALDPEKYDQIVGIIDAIEKTNQNSDDTPKIR